MSDIFSSKLCRRDGVTLLAVFVIVSFVGFIIVTSMIVISTNALNIGIEGGVSVRATALNRACVEKALYAIRNDSFYVGIGSSTLDNASCFYLVVDQGSNTKIITVTSTINSLIRVEEVGVFISPSYPIPTVTSWREKP